MKRLAIGLGLALGLQTLAGAPGAWAATQQSPLATVLAEDGRLAAKHQHPIVVFDLDDTLFATADRNLAIIKEWAATPDGAPYRQKLDALTRDQIPYDIDGVLEANGVPAKDMPAITTFWAKRFFTSDYVKYDRPEPGAVDYVRAVLKSGAQVVYLTGRPSSMEPGTRAALIKAGFPWDSKGKTVRLLLKSQSHQKDAAFKYQAALELAKTGTIVAGFDNEPANVNAIHKAAPKALVVYLKTVHSANPPAVDPGIVQLANYDWK
ncbi:MAG TPA: HAD family hydrolase [Oscillatoriaceae cyanobacterium]